MTVASDTRITGPKLLLQGFKMGLSFNALDHLKEELPMFHYVAKIVSTGAEHYEDVPTRWDAQAIAETAVRKAKITTSRSNPKTCTVEVSELKIKLGSVERQALATVAVKPPFAPMTEGEYQDELKRILMGIPEAFRGYVSKQAWDQGHSAGYEEIINIAGNIVSDLLPSIKAFEIALLNRHQNLMDNPSCTK